MLLLRYLLLCGAGCFMLAMSATSMLGAESNVGSVFSRIVKIVKSEYVEYLSDADISALASKSLLSNLDPHSTYLSAKEYKELKNATSGEFAGLGMEITMENGIVKVIAPYQESPSDKAGIKAGDYIVEVNSRIIKGFSLIEVSEMLKGEPGTKVIVKIYREGVGYVQFDIVRDIIKISPVQSKVISDNIAYFKIAIFNDKTSATIYKEWLLLKKNHPNIGGVILDCRSNPGGLLNQATEVTDLFLNGGDIVTIKSRDKLQNHVFKANSVDITDGLPIIVLINGGSASAAEILAGALQDNKRAIILGTQSFGKGSVQKIIPLSDGAAVKITTALYYTPSGASIQAHGIVPDIVVPDIALQAVEKKSFNLSESSLNKHITKSGAVSKKIPTFSSVTPTIAELEDFQLLRATDMIKIMSIYKKTFIDKKNVQKTSR